MITKLPRDRGSRATILLMTRVAAVAVAVLAALSVPGSAHAATKGDAPVKCRIVSSTESKPFYSGPRDQTGRIKVTMKFRCWGQEKLVTKRYVYYVDRSEYVPPVVVPGVR